MSLDRSDNLIFYLEENENVEGMYTLSPGFHKFFCERVRRGGTLARQDFLNWMGI